MPFWTKFVLELVEKTSIGEEEAAAGNRRRKKEKRSSSAENGKRWTSKSEKPQNPWMESTFDFLSTLENKSTLAKVDKINNGTSFQS